VVRDNLNAFTFRDIEEPSTHDVVLGADIARFLTLSLTVSSHCLAPLSFCREDVKETRVGLLY